MPVTVNTLNAENFRHSVNINNHELFTDLPKSLGGDDSAPSPHDYFDAALASCKALTVKLYAQKKDIPLTGVGLRWWRMRCGPWRIVRSSRPRKSSR